MEHDWWRPTLLQRPPLDRRCCCKRIGTEAGPAGTLMRPGSRKTIRTNTSSFDTARDRANDKTQRQSWVGCSPTHARTSTIATMSASGTRSACSSSSISQSVIQSHTKQIQCNAVHAKIRSGTYSRHCVRRATEFVECVCSQHNDTPGDTSNTKSSAQVTSTPPFIVTTFSADACQIHTVSARPQTQRKNYFSSHHWD